MLVQLVASFFATASFGVIFSVPKRLLLSCGLVGMAGWISYLSASHYGIASVPATLIASFLLASLSLLLARLHRAPVTVFSAPGIIPLVPGGLAYDAMRYFIENDYNTALQYSTKTLMISGAIAMGLVLAEVLFQLLRRPKEATRAR